MSEISKRRHSKLIVVVLYKTTIASAATLHSLSLSREYLTLSDHIFVWDNSPTAIDASEWLAYKDQFSATITYHHSPQNTSLAKVYNTVISGNATYELVYLFDQDSGFHQQYFEQTDRAADANPGINLFVPLIISNNIIVSPGHFHYFKGEYWRKPQVGKLQARNTVAITSGMCIRMKFLEKFSGFEEELMVYGVDSNFMIRYARENEFFFVINVPFEHHLSEFAAEDLDVKQRRFQDFKKSSRINARLFPLPVRWMTDIFLLYRTIKFRLFS